MTTAPLYTAKRCLNNFVTELRIDNQHPELIWDAANILDSIDALIQKAHRIPHVSEIPLAIPEPRWRRLVPRIFRRIA